MDVPYGTEFERLKASTFLGRPVLKAIAKPDVIFDPANKEHRDAARAMFLGTTEEKGAVPFNFKLEPPYGSVKAMVHAKIFNWVTKPDEINDCTCGCTCHYCSYPTCKER